MKRLSKMKRLSIIVFLIPCIIVGLAEKANLNYHYIYEYEPDGDIAQIQLLINVKDGKMSKMVQRADLLKGQIQQLSEQYCRQNKLKNCRVKVKSLQETITPLYKLVNKKISFSSYQVQQRVIIKVKNVQGIAFLIDKLVNLSSEIQMIDFSFTAQQEQQIQRKSLEAALQEAFKLCKQMKGQLHTITKVQEVASFGNEQEDVFTQNEEQQDQNNQDQIFDTGSSPTVIEWNFEAVCKLD